MKRYFLLFVLIPGFIICFILLCAIIVKINSDYRQPVYSSLNGPGLAAQPMQINVRHEQIPGLPRKRNLTVPFFAQAPRGDWSYPYQEACEEASCLLVANVYHDLKLNTDSFERELLKLIAWETKWFGYYHHTTVEETAIILEQYLGLKTVVHKNPDLSDIAAIIRKNHLIIAPLAGKLLNNPFYTNGGPVYHMLVIKGYDLDKNEVITNDVGTRQGADLVYQWSTIENALHDWHESNMLLGEKLIIEVWP